MKLRSRGGKKGETRNEKSTAKVDELVEIALEQMKQCLQSSSSHTPLPEVLVLDNDNDNNDTDGTLGDKKLKNKPVLLSSSLDPGPLPKLYFDTEQITTRLVDEVKDVKQKQQHNDEETIFTSNVVKSKRALQKERKAEREKFAGPNWFNMPAPEMTPELKNDLKIIQIRNSLDRSHYYKSSDWKKTLPKYFQMGTVVEDATDYYSARIPKKQRKRTMVEELLSDKQFKKYHTHKYNELQKKRQQQAMRKKTIMNKRNKKR